MKRAVSILLITMLLCATFLPVTMAAGTATVSASQAVINAAGEAVVSFDLTGNTGFKAYEITIEYAAPLELVKIEAGSLSEGLFTSKVETATVAFATNTPVTSDGTLFTATFKIDPTKEGDHSVAANVKALGMSNTASMDVESEQGSVIVPHVCTLTAVNEIPATCKATGVKAHYACECGKLYSDAAGTKEVKAEDLVIALAAHKFGEAVKTTVTENGIVYDVWTKTCGVCGYEKVTKRAQETEEPEVPVIPVVPTYNVTVPADIAGGTVTVSNTNPEQGEIITITATPDRNYKLTDVIINGVSYGPISPINYVVYGDLSITATFVYEPSFIEGAGSDSSKPSMFDKVLGIAGAFPNYKDVLPTDWFYTNIMWAWSRNILDKGVTFAPNTNATRATIVEWIWRMEGRPVVYGVAFDDTTAMSAAWAASAGIVNGYGNGKFGPDDLVTREQLAAILYRYANYKGINTNARGDLSKFSDAAKISDYAVEPMQWAVGVGMINGYPNGTVAPQGNATRAELTALLNRMSVWYGI